MRRMTRTGLARWKHAAVALGAGLLVAACGSSGTPSGTSSPPATSAVPPSAAPSPTSVLCQDAAALRASLDNLIHVNVHRGAAGEIKADLADVKAKLTTFTDQAHGQFQAQISAVNAALAQLQPAVSDLAANPSASTVAGVVTA